MIAVAVTCCDETLASIREKSSEQLCKGHRLPQSAIFTCRYTMRIHMDDLFHHYSQLNAVCQCVAG